jgi:hypothetical protein
MRNVINNINLKNKNFNVIKMLTNIVKCLSKILTKLFNKNSDYEKTHIHTRCVIFHELCSDWSG